MLRPFLKTPFWTMTLGLAALGLAAAPAFGKDRQANTQIEVEYAKGELAYAQKDFAAAEKHFRTLIGQYPDAARAHYFLALSYLGESKIPQAKVHFKTVVDIGKPAALVKEAQAYLTDLEGKKAGEAFNPDAEEKPNFYAFNFSLGYRYDSNLLLNPQSISFVSHQNDHAWDAFVRAAVFPVQQEHWMLGFDYSFYNSYYFEHQGFRFNQHRVSGISARKYGIFSTLFNPSFSALFMDGGRDRYEFLVQLPGSLRLDYAERWASELYYRFEIRDFSNVASRDLNITNAFLKNGTAHYPGFAQHLYFMDKKGVAKLGFEFPIENASHPYDAAGPKGFGSLMIPLPYESSVEMFGSYMKKFYFNDYLPDIGFTPNGINRRDDVIEAGVSLKKNLWKALWAQGGYTFLNNNSNEIVYDTKNHMAMFFIGFDL